MEKVGEINSELKRITYELKRDGLLVFDIGALSSIAQTVSIKPGEPQTFKLGHLSGTHQLDNSVLLN